jgi:hypothetical protein
VPPTNEPPPADSPPLARAVTLCRAETRLLAELAEMLSRVDAAPDAPCRECGRCCRFEEFGHRLYVSAGELALLTGSPPPSACEAGRCGYQVGPHCTARGRRPLGCRAFFCEMPSERAEAVYEPLHREIRHLHDRFALPYLYVELSGALAALAEADG